MWEGAQGRQMRTGPQGRGRICRGTAGPADKGLEAAGSWSSRKNASQWGHMSPQWKTGMAVAHASNLSDSEAEVGGSRVPGQSEQFRQGSKQLSKILSQNKK